jgi:hypothetical protein
MLRTIRAISQSNVARALGDASVNLANSPLPARSSPPINLNTTFANDFVRLHYRLLSEHRANEYIPRYISSFFKTGVFWNLVIALEHSFYFTLESVAKAASPSSRTRVSFSSPFVQGGLGII